MITTTIHKTNRAVRCLLCPHIIRPGQEYCMTITIPIEGTVCQAHRLGMTLDALRDGFGCIDLNILPLPQARETIGLLKAITHVEVEYDEHPDRRTAA